MGLDMYLSASMYVGGWDHSDDEEKSKYANVLDKLGLKGFRCNGSPSLTAKVNVAYWRKANAIHAWFVANVQDGKDECEETYVERKQLEQLVKTCQEVLDSSETVEGDIHTGTTWHRGTVTENYKKGQVLANQAIAEKLLPMQDGFFFGGTDYNEYYLDALRDTVKQLRAVLDDERFKGWEFYYCSSW